MDNGRVNPDELLRAIINEGKSGQRGHLKIFFGYAAGVGKTYSMLKAAHAAKQRGADVVVGYVEPHARPQTTDLLNGLELIPTAKFTASGIELSEFDIDAALIRKPQLIIVDELAHTNAPGSRHEKRFQDIEELLKAGIDVYTTVNVQHIESLCDMVASITGVVVRERIPDKVFDNADQIRLVDIKPQELIERMQTGLVYKEIQAHRALNSFFSMENLTALREIALRRCADRMNKLSDSARIKNNSDYYTDEHILVCLSSSPTNPKIIRTAARMSHAFKASFTALFVETPDFQEMGDKDKEQLRSNIRLAEQLGATIETVYGDDAAFQISEFARLSGVSKIILGRNNAKRKNFFSKPPLIEKLTAYSPNLDIYIIPDKDTPTYHNKGPQIQKSFFIILAVTLIGYLFDNLGFSETNTITIYILGVLVIAIVTSGKIYSLVSSVICVIIFNFFFTAPKFTFTAYDSGYPATFLIMFAAAFITSSLALKIKKHAKQSAQTAFRTKILFDTNRLLQQAKGKNSIISVTANQLIKLLKRDIVFYVNDGGKPSTPFIFSAEEKNSFDELIAENEQAVAAWVLKNNKRAGATTSTLMNAKCIYLAVRINDCVYVVVGIAVGCVPIDAFENSILLSIIGECALALENEKASREKEEAAILARNEQLRANLLRSISHDLRTPLTSISGNAGILLSGEESLSKNKKIQLYSDIYDDSMWLMNLVENLLAVTRIEDGTLHLKTSAELLDDIISEALHHLNRLSIMHNIKVYQPQEFVMVKVDARLIVQVIINIVDNAIKYNPKGSDIDITIKREMDKAVVAITDNGPGVSDKAKPRIFDMFYTDDTVSADSRRSLGLGLSLCKSIITAHGGDISVSDNKPSGAVFTFTLPVEEVMIHE